jgi:hypothetical protein
LRTAEQMAAANGTRATAVTLWWIEYENGDRSIDYDSEAEAWAVLTERQFQSKHPRPCWLFSSDGERFVIPVKHPVAGR